MLHVSEPKPRLPHLSAHWFLSLADARSKIEARGKRQ
jgi:hypothetical protein